MGSPNAPPDGSCPSDETVALFIDGALAPAQETSIRLHVDGCARCRQVLAGLVGSGGASQPTAVSEGGAKLPLSVGQVVRRKYRIDGVLGAGGMATVFRAYNLGLGRTIAIKVMHPELLRDTDATRRFSHEARAAASIDHPHAVRIMDVDTLEESELPFLVMEYLEGKDLGAVSEVEGPMEFDRALRYIAQGAAAIGAGHALGIVHRDIKPENLFLTTSDVVKVVDFGLAKTLSLVSSGSGSQNTQTKMILGSPHYMSPEQVRSSRNVDARTDIWALGATLFHLVVGRPPFAAPNLYLLCARVLSDEPPPMARLRPGVPLRLENVVKRCMKKQANERFATIDELIVAIEDAREHLGDVEAETVAPRGRRYSVHVDIDAALGGRTLRSGDDTTPMSLAETATRVRRPLASPPTSLEASQASAPPDPPLPVTEAMPPRAPKTPDPPLPITEAMPTRAPKTPKMPTPRRKG
jgi:eukaryotic-like serine/threonine-protein kinase